MTKKIFIVSVVTISLVAALLVIVFIGTFWYQDLVNKQLIKQCEQTVYNIKNVQQKSEYTLKNDPSQNKLKIKIGDIDSIKNAKATYLAGSGGFESCVIEQEVLYTLWFNNRFLAVGDYYNPNSQLDSLGNVASFGDNPGFRKYGAALDPSKQYNLEELFLNSFNIQEKNGLFLYTKIKGDSATSGEFVDSNIVFVMDGDSAEMIDIPDRLFPSNIGQRKIYTDFKKNDDKLEITFSLDSEIVRTLKDQSKGGFFGEEEYARLWNSGTRTFCFEKSNLYSEKERLRLKDLKENNPNYLEKELKEIYGSGVREKWEEIYGKNFDEHKYNYYTLCSQDRQVFSRLLN